MTTETSVPGPTASDAGASDKMRANWSRRLLAPATWRLRTRLLVALLALLTATTVAIGALTIVSLDRYLVSQLDDQLAVAAGRSQSTIDSDDDRRDRNDARRPSGLPVPPPASALVTRGQPSGTIAALVVNGQVLRAVVLDDDGSPEQLDPADLSALTDVEVDDDFESVNLGDSLGEYRVAASSTREGAVLISGLPMAPLNETLARLTAIISAIALIGLATAALIGAFIINVSLRPLRRVATTATTVANQPLDSGEVALSARVPEQDTDPNNEVGQVGAALNHLLENVATALSARHASEMRVRNFVADASHELRTPLASIRGYSELTRRCDAELPSDITHALGRIESESIRMTSLVDDLLLLARLDTGRPMQSRPVDLSAIVVAALSDAHVASPAHNWNLSLPADPVIVQGDPDRLAQIVGNLLTNARVHTPATTTVNVGLQVQSGDDGPGADSPKLSVLTVQDDGPGIPPSLVPEVFGRFSRGDTSRSREAGSTGLGLAIVAAVVGALGGTIKVRSAVGDTTFTVALPLASGAN